MTGLSSVDVKNIGAGGGSIAWIDSGRAPARRARRAPAPSRARPATAPAAREPTVTDAALVLGYIDPDYFLGGRMRARSASARARRSPSAVAEPLGLGRRAARRTPSSTIANEHMVERDPRHHDQRGARPARRDDRGRRRRRRHDDRADRRGARLPRACSCRGRPASCRPAAACSPTSSRSSASAGGRTRTASTTPPSTTGSRQLPSRCDEFFDRLQTARASAARRSSSSRRATRTRCGSSRSRCARGRFEAAPTSTTMVEAFHQVHERVFAVSEPGQHIECIYWKGRATRAPRQAALAAREPCRRRRSRPQPATRPPGSGRRVDADRLLRGRASPPGTALAGPRSSRSRRRPSSSRPAGPRPRDGHRRLRADPRSAEHDDRLRARRSIPVLLAVLANRFESIVREMTNTLLRSGRSAVLNMARDFSCSLITSDNELLASAEGLPVHVIGTEFLAEAMTELHPDFAEGDAFLHNDPYSATRIRPTTRSSCRCSSRASTVHRVREGPPGRLRQRAADHLHAGARRDVYEEGALNFPCVRGAARLPRHRRHHPHVPAADPRARPVVRRLPGGARRGADRRAAAEGAVRPVRRRDGPGVHPRVVRLQRAADGRGDRAAAQRRRSSGRVDARPVSGRSPTACRSRSRCTIDADEGRSSSTSATTPTTIRAGSTSRGPARRTT